MRAYILLTLFISLVWSKDVLILNNGETLEGEFLEIKFKKVSFQPENSDFVKMIRVNEIKSLMKGDQLIVLDGSLNVEGKKYLPKLNDASEKQIISSQQKSITKNRYLVKAGGYSISAGAILIGISIRSPESIEKMSAKQLEKYGDRLYYSQQIGFGLIALGGIILALGD